MKYRYRGKLKTRLRQNFNLAFDLEIKARKVKFKN